MVWVKFTLSTLATVANKIGNLNSHFWPVKPFSGTSKSSFYTQMTRKGATMDPIQDRLNKTCWDDKRVIRN